MKKSQYTLFQRLVAALLAVCFLLPSFPVSTYAEAPSLDHPEWQSAPDHIRLQVYPDETTGELYISEEDVVWELLLNEDKAEKDAAAVELQMSADQILAPVHRDQAGAEIQKITAVYKDKNKNKQTLFDRALTEKEQDALFERLSKEENALVSKDIDKYRIQVDALNTETTLYFTTTYENAETVDFEILATIKINEEENPVKAYTKITVPSRETVDIPVTLHTEGLEEGETKPETVLTLTNSHTGEEYYETGSDNAVFSALPKYTKENALIQYKLTAQPVEGFETEVDGYTVTHTKIIEETPEEETPATEAPVTEALETPETKEDPKTEATATEAPATEKTEAATEVAATEIEDSKTEENKSEEKPADTEPEAVTEEKQTEGELDAPDERTEATNSEISVPMEPSAGNLNDLLIRNSNLPPIKELAMSDFTTMAQAQTYSGEGSLVDGKGSYTWRGTISAAGDSIDWEFTVSKVRVPLANQIRALFRITVPEEFYTLQGIDITTNGFINDKINPSIPGRTYRMYDDSNRGQIHSR